MSYAPRPQSHNLSSNANMTSTSTSSLRHGASSTSSSHAQSMLQARIAAKRAELDNLRQLRDLSGNLASQLAGLEAKLSTLRDGAQSVALVLANWQNVLRAINMAAIKVPRQPPRTTEDNDQEGEEEEADAAKPEPQQHLPVPLVRIPVQPPKTEEGG